MTTTTPTGASAVLDPATVRASFPGLATEWALFDNAGGSLPCRGVIDRVADYMSRRCVQLGASYAQSVEATAAVDAGRRAVAQLVNAERDEIVLGASSSMHVRTLAAALRPQLAPGDEVIVTSLDHASNRTAWRALAEHGVVVREWPFDARSLSLELDGLEPLLGPRTRLVCFTHCSNIVGTVQDAARIVARVHAAGALACVDGVAFAPHRRVDVKALDADFYFATLYKVFGPHTAFLFGRRELLRAARNQNHEFFAETDVPGKLEPGGPPHELAAALPGIVEHLESLDDGPSDRPSQAKLDRAFERIAATEAALVAPLLDFLERHPRTHIVGSSSASDAARVPTVAFTVDGRKASEIPPLLDRRKVAVRWGHFYARRLIEDLGLLERDGVVRASLAHYNTPDEVARLVDALDEVL